MSGFVNSYPKRMKIN